MSFLIMKISIQNPIREKNTMFSNVFLFRSFYLNTDQIGLSTRSAKQFSVEINKLTDLQFPGDTTDTNFVQLNCDKDYVIEIKLSKIRLCNVEQRQRAITPKFNKPKGENWSLVLEQRSNELTEMK